MSEITQEDLVLSLLCNPESVKKMLDEITSLRTQLAKRDNIIDAASDVLTEWNRGDDIQEAIFILEGAFADLDLEE